MIKPDGKPTADRPELEGCRPLRPYSDDLQEPRPVGFVAADRRSFAVALVAELIEHHTVMLFLTRGAAGCSRNSIDTYQKRQLTPNLVPKHETSMLIEAPIGLIDEARMGLSSQRAELLARRLNLTDKEIARLLAVSIRTFHRLGTEGRLDAVASERLLLLERLAQHGEDVFEDQDAFNGWLRRPLRPLSGHAPLDLLDTSTGLTLVDTILGRIEYGVYS